MKKLVFILFSSVTLLSCGGDDDSNSNNSNSLTVNGNNYTITDAKAVDNFRFFSETHAEYNFVLASAPITIEAIPGTLFGFNTDNAKFAINLSIAALGDTFQNGAYPYYEDAFLEEPNSNYFDTFTIYIDENQDGIYSGPNDRVLTATSGTVTVSGTAPNYVLNFDVELSNGTNFNYTYNQGFDYVDNRSI